jgi:gamma-tubulin complex component 5
MLVLLINTDRHGNMTTMSHPTSKSNSNRSSKTTSRTPIGRSSSSLSVRPSSSLSTTRPQSRFSQQRPHSRQARSRVGPICQTLVAQVTGLKADGSENDPEGQVFREKLDYAVKNLEPTTIVKAAASVDMGVIDRHISGWVCRSLS